ncbi:MAG: 30S ribosomal protein S16 [Anaerolinea sp.]|nr:30S ribosomal protein S16 [Anaerolinea sp.]MCC6973115.1 30S ribosomal protein S16 [Anaerolineae bacterium]CAG0979521.1 30S ribosomal protein S16 [Anaerolineae bacterium]
MVRIRLRRVGLKKQPSYRIVVADQESPRNGAYIEVIGFYNPRTQPATVDIKEDRALYWLSVGAQPSEGVVGLLKGNGTLERLERLRKGEAMEALVNEAAAIAAKRPAVSGKTRQAAPATK